MSLTRDGNSSALFFFFFLAFGTSTIRRAPDQIRSVALSPPPVRSAELYGCQAARGLEQAKTVKFPAIFRRAFRISPSYDVAPTSYSFGARVLPSHLGAGATPPEWRRARVSRPLEPCWGGGRGRAYSETAKGGAAS